MESNSISNWNRTKLPECLLKQEYQKELIDGEVLLLHSWVFLYWFRVSCFAWHELGQFPSKLQEIVCLYCGLLEREFFVELSFPDGSELFDCFFGERNADRVAHPGECLECPYVYATLCSLGARPSCAIDAGTLLLGKASMMTVVSIDGIVLSLPPTTL